MWGLQVILCWFIDPMNYNDHKVGLSSWFVSWLVGGIRICPSEKYDFVSWDDEIPIYYGKI
jgi:hypothetical protein